MLISIIGPAYAGKDTLATQLKQNWAGKCILLRTGRECRRRFSEEEMSKDPNPHAPGFTEEFVRRLIVESWCAAKVRGWPCIIVGNPRTPHQVDWMTATSMQYDDQILILRMRVTLETQLERMQQRDGASEEALKLGAARIERDNGAVDLVCNQIIGCPFVSLVEVVS